MPEAVKASPRIGKLRTLLALVTTRPVARDFCILLGFAILTAAMTWPWVTRLRDAIADPGDPYSISWLLWWDYHQTFHDPLHLFNANIFYPLKNTLAFSENDYGIALLFFPLFALGFRPLTVNSVATFLGFAFCGYAAFRLTRTLTNSTSAGWIAGIVFAFIPYRFHLLSHLHYLWAGWLPLLLESLVLFARERSWKRAIWFALSFIMNALTCLSWFIFSLLPLALTAGYLIFHYDLVRDRKFWLRGAIVTLACSLVLSPFMLPYHEVSQTYGFKWNREVVDSRSPTLANWLIVEHRNKLWSGFGENLSPLGYRLFPGLLPLLLAFFALIFGLVKKRSDIDSDTESGPAGNHAVLVLDVLCVACLILLVVLTGWSGSSGSLFGDPFNVVTVDRVLLLLVAGYTLRLCLSYPQLLRDALGRKNLIESIRSGRDSYWIGTVWLIVGLLMSLGTNSWLYRVLFDFVFLFRAIREPSHASMIAYLGLAVISGCGAINCVAAVQRRWRTPRLLLLIPIAGLLLVELNAAPLNFLRGAVFPSELALRLKETPMRGGLVELPTGGGELPHLYMLRAADHGKPLVNAIMTFVPPHSYEIDSLARETPIPMKLVELIERVPTSYLVVHTQLLRPERRSVYEAFLSAALSSGRLRYINSFDGGSELYAVVRNEPEARTENPEKYVPSEWSQLVSRDPVKLLIPYNLWSEAILRLNVVSSGALPDYDGFLRDIKTVGQGLYLGQEDEFNKHLLEYTKSIASGKEFQQSYDGLDDQQYVRKLFSNAGVNISAEEVAQLADLLKFRNESRAYMLLKIASDQRVVDQQHARAIVLLHFFAYLRRNPGDPPDSNMDGFNYWVGEVKKHGGEDLARSFVGSQEYQERDKRSH